ncbi:ribonuclease HII [Fluviispira sanaruensis]|uniref:Ribonuclease n=1 Tax=Fluviispira sanaruensis TaxID=2493639 RepID=A0A4P2VKS5_FLUSA|nr:ribonuclease HII [Fluviispira sanaruensis]BBH52310.1 ribonuclease HII [Fluviispira sanaruensis]
MTFTPTRFKNENILLKILSSEFEPKEEFSAIIAIDEVGRGCVAGSVVSCASLWVRKNVYKNIHFKEQEWLAQIRDSKKLSEKKRKICFEKIIKEYNYSLITLPIDNNSPTSPFNIYKSTINKKIDINCTQNELKLFNSQNSTDFECISFALGEVNSQEVDEFNIWNSVQLAASRALELLFHVTKLNIKDKNNIFSQAILLMDGNHSIKVPSRYIHNMQITVIKADDLFVSVGFSSILAKVYRDSCMETQDTFYPIYGFANHKGYGTPKHLAIIQECGISPIHRTSFLKNYIPQTLF